MGSSQSDVSKKESFVNFNKLHKMHRNFLVNGMMAYNLSPNEISVLQSLAVLKSPTAISVAKECDVSKALISRSIKLLQEKELIAVEVSAADKREFSLTLTTKGKIAEAEITALEQRFIKVAFSDLGDEALEILTAILGLMQKNLNSLV